MKTPAKIFCLLSATCLAFASLARAQLVTYQTVSSWTGSVITFNGNTGSPSYDFTSQNGSVLGETFSNVSAIANMTYNFFSASGISAAGSVEAEFGEWNTSTNSFVGTTVDFGVISIPTSSSWTQTITVGANNYATYEVNLNFGGNYVTDPTKTYALLFQNTSSSATGFGLGLDNTNPFSYGQSYDGQGDYAGKDYAFAQIVLVPNGNNIPSPIPESGTVASILGALFVAGLVIFRLRQRRQALVTAPVAAA